jgi:hypothetical protein
MAQPGNSKGRVDHCGQVFLLQGEKMLKKAIVLTIMIVVPGSLIIGFLAIVAKRLAPMLKRNTAESLA